MFVKKDLRKIPQILAEATGDNIPDEKRLKELRLARRPAEFNGSVTILCQPKYASALRDVVSLSLYDCQISNLSDIGFLGSKEETPNKRFKEAETNQNESFREREIVCPKLSLLNLGRNPLTTLPTDLSYLHRSLTSLWLDDCEISGPMPDCIYDLVNLKTLRLSNNNITTVKGKDGLAKLGKLQVLCLDGNRIEVFPALLGDELMQLESLQLR